MCAHVIAAASKWHGSMCVVCCKGTMNGVSRSLLLKCMYGTISSKSCYTAYILPLYSAFSWWHSDFVGDNHFFLFFYLCYLLLSTECTKHKLYFCPHFLYPLLVFCLWMELTYYFTQQFYDWCVTCRKCVFHSLIVCSFPFSFFGLLCEYIHNTGGISLLRLA